MPNRIDVLMERVSNVQEDVRSMNDRFDKWEKKNEEFSSFKSGIEGAVKGVSGSVKVGAWVLGIIQAVIGAGLGFWIGFVSMSVTGTGEKMQQTGDRVTKLESQHESQQEKNRVLDDQLAGINHHNAEFDADVNKRLGDAELAIDRLSRSKSK